MTQSERYAYECMNAPKWDNSINEPLLYLFQPQTQTRTKKNERRTITIDIYVYGILTVVLLKPRRVHSSGVAQHWFWFRFVRCVPLQHTSFHCPSFVYPFSNSPFTVCLYVCVCVVHFLGLFMLYTHSFHIVYATPKSKSAENVCYQRQLAFDRCRACALFTASERLHMLFQSTTKCFFCT